MLYEVITFFAAQGLAAVQVHQDWLEEELLANASGEFRLGREKFERKLSYALQSPLSRAEIKARARNNFV